MLLLQTDAESLCLIVFCCSHSDLPRKLGVDCIVRGSWCICVSEHFDYQPTVVLPYSSFPFAGISCVGVQLQDHCPNSKGCRYSILNLTLLQFLWSQLLTLER